jgi:gliding motility-associated-like protein
VSDVVITNILIDSNAGEPQVLCADNTILAANNPYPGTGNWSLEAGSGAASFIDFIDPLTAVTNLDRGDNVLVWTIDYKGCKSESKVTITNNRPNQAFAGLNDAVCEPTYTLAANTPISGGTGEWSTRDGGGDFTSITDPSASVSNLSLGDNIFRWTIEHQNCISFADVKIEYNRIEAEAGGDRAICASETVLEGNNALPGVGAWSVPGGEGSAVFSTISNPSTTVSNLRKGTNLLRWTITNKGCVDSDDVQITNNLPSEPYAGNTQILCSDSTLLDATTVDIGTGEWTVGSGAGVFVNYKDEKTKVKGLSQGDNIMIWTVTNGLCTLQDEVLIVNNQPSLPYAGADYVEVCENKFQLKAETPEYGAGQWTILEGGGTLSDYNNPRAVITLLNHGINRFRWTVSAGQCALSDEVKIINNTPTKANAGPDIEDCRDWQILDGNIPGTGTGTWALASGNGTIVEIDNPKASVTGLGFGKNVFLWSIVEGNCISTDSVNVSNKVPDLANAGYDLPLTICQNYYGLNGNEPITGSGKWIVLKGTGTFTNPSTYNSMVTNIGFGENIFQWQINYGECVTTDEIVVINNKSIADAGEDQIVYEPSTTLNANNVGGLSSGWHVVGTSSAVFNDPQFFNTRVTNLSNGINTFKWEINVNGCIVSDFVSVDYRPIPNAAFITNIENGCYPITVRFTNYSAGGLSYHWDFGDGNSSGDRNPVHTYEHPGKFTVTLSSEGPDGNDGISTKIIDVYDHPTANFTVNPQLVYIPGDNARFYDLSTDAASWFWNFGDGNTSELRNPTYAYQNAGAFDVKLTVANNYGCKDSLQLASAVIAELEGFIAFPNAFSPRSSGSSDYNSSSNANNTEVFKPVFRDVDTYLLQIFNRWGQLIFESTDVNVGWDGLYQGQLSPQAVYVFKASGKYFSGREFRETGSVLLVR